MILPGSLLDHQAEGFPEHSEGSICRWRKHYRSHATISTNVLQVFDSENATIFILILLELLDRAVHATNDSVCLN